MGAGRRKVLHRPVAAHYHFVIMNTQFDDAASWDYAQIWDKFPVPARPSKEELEFLEQGLAAVPNANVLILGSTIEYRSLCKRLGIAPVVADFEKSHYDTLTKYAQETFPSEKFLEIDWLEVNDVDTYDVIVGHRPFNVIGKEVMPRFFERMRRALKPGGIFYCKGNILYNNERERFDELVDTWAFAKNREYPLFSYVEVHLYFHTADPDGYVVYPKARAVVDQLIKDKRCSREDYELMRLLVSMSEKARFRGLITEQEVRATVDTVGFSGNEWVILDKDICQNMPIIKLKK